MLCHFFSSKNKHRPGNAQYVVKVLASKLLRLTCMLLILMDCVLLLTTITYSYVSDILAQTPKNVDQVTIEPNGKWSPPSEIHVTPKRNGVRTSSSDDDDLVEIKDMPRIAAVKTEQTQSSILAARTLPSSIREESAVRATGSTGGSKRTAQVIEISSDEDEEEPARPTKRQATLSMLNGLSSFSNSKPPTQSSFVPRNYANPLWMESSVFEGCLPSSFEISSFLAFSGRKAELVTGGSPSDTELHFHGLHWSR